MSRHRPETLADAAANAELEAALRVADAELKRRSAYARLKNLEQHLAKFAPVPGDAPYVETFPNFAKS